MNRVKLSLNNSLLWGFSSTGLSSLSGRTTLAVRVRGRGVLGLHPVGFGGRRPIGGRDSRASLDHVIRNHHEKGLELPDKLGLASHLVQRHLELLLGKA